MKLFKLAGALLLVAILYGAWLIARDAPLFKIEKVAVTGLHGSVVPGVRQRLEQAGLGMTTTHVDVAALTRAVASYTVVKGLHVKTQFPHGLTIDVTEQLPVAALVVGQARLPVAPDGIVVHGLTGPTGILPTFTSSTLPSADQVTDPVSLASLEVLDIAPAVLRRTIVRVGPGSGGLTVFLRNGPRLYFGDTSRLHAKWAAAARVLADQQSRGATYVDVRLPDRPAAAVNDPATSAAASAGAAETGAPLTAAALPNQPSTSTGG